MPPRKRPKTYPAKTQWVGCSKPPTSYPQRVFCLGESAADSAHQPGPENQERGSRKRPRCPTVKATPTTGPSGAAPKRKRDSTHDSQSLKSPSYEPLDDEVSVSTSSKKICAATSEGTFKSRYSVGEQLGSGGYGSVYAGTRKSDGAQPGDGSQLPLEVALMTIVSQPEECPNIIKLLDWYDGPKYFILVMERPSPCVDLFDYIEMRGGQLTELEARDIMRQLVNAFIHCHDRGVFHRDLKTENVLVNIDDGTVKVIDFGCGDLLKDSYQTFAGTKNYTPPEWYVHRSYKASPSTAWTLGLVLFELICGDLPFDGSEEITFKQPTFTEGLSEECQHLITMCLKKEPSERPTLEGILAHRWMSGDK
ncbi:hypothetical protein ACEWY4_019923 [Coilia grayii]|uniref:non-specific serine/threonine protein kinase n=1 Tax=Coilia grayii TaxID=363190 RepID=A0ABD1JDI1_9TELE